MSHLSRIALLAALFVLAAATSGEAAPPTIESWPLCELIGPGAQRPGVFGTDLGFTFRHPYRDASGGVDERIVFLFGDTWPTFDSPCTEPPWTNDDAVATLRLADLPEYPPGPPATGDAAPRCPVLDFGAPDPLHDRPLRVLFEGRDIDLSYNRTPLTGWSDGRRPYGLFTDAQLAACTRDDECGAGRTCARGEFGRCAVDPCPAGQQCPRDAGLDDALPMSVCRLDRDDCASPVSPRRRCVADTQDRGLCTDATGSLWVTGSAAHPQDPDRRLLVTRWVYVAAEDPARPNVFETVARFPTAKFLNPSARTVDAFDPDDPSRNDYRHGRDTLLIWGRPFFQGAEGASAWLYLLHNTLELTDGAGTLRWAPRYFAGLGDDGRPRWSDAESDAAPLYTAEFDIVNQLSVSWVEPLGVWVMLYGGYVLDATRSAPEAYPAPAPGAVHLRWSKEPWGEWSEPIQVPRPTDAPQLLACSGPNTPAGGAKGDRVRPIDFFRARLTGVDCHVGNPGFDRGIFYSANVIEELTRAVPATASGARAAELVWEISTWNPYAVWLVKSRVELPP